MEDNFTFPINGIVIFCEKFKLNLLLLLFPLWRVFPTYSEKNQVQTKIDWDLFCLIQESSVSFCNSKFSVDIAGVKCFCEGSYSCSCTIEYTYILFCHFTLPFSGLLQKLR